jgi:nucleotide-binding universal stress UspA family protein
MSGRGRTAPEGIRDVVVCLTEEGRGEEGQASVAYGLALASAAGAHLTVQSASRRIVATTTLFPNLTRGLVAAGNRRIDALARAVAEHAAGDAAMAGVPCTVEARRLSYREVLARIAWHGRLADLTILDAEPGEVDIDRELIEAALFATCRPVVVVPPSCDAFAVDRVMVAWDGGAPAARALNDAMPFLRAAREVEVVSVVGEKPLPADAVIAPHLARHGVNVSVAKLEMGRNVPETLREHLRRTRADMLVMGAFRHSRVREWFLGGVTQSLLGSCPVPLFLAH